MNLTSLDDIKNLFYEFQCETLYLKILQKNDNSKQQVYLGSNFAALNIFPQLKISHDEKNLKILKSPLKFSWITNDKKLSKAPKAQIIFYPQYPEVRFSGFLQKSIGAPKEVMVKRETGRLLFFGFRQNGEVLGLAIDSDNIVTEKILKEDVIKKGHILHEIVILDEINSKKELLVRLEEIFEEGWIKAKRLDGNGEFQPCKGTNCGGYTLEALLGVKNNGISEPDFLGWEVKQFKSTNLVNPSGAAITLFTPEPNQGFYKSEGVNSFIKKYGYKDKSGVENRLNFSSPHKMAIINSNTGLTLGIEGYDHVKNKITDVRGGIVLIDSEGTLAAKWNFAELMEHWNKKHNQAVYVPSQMKKDNQNIFYRYGSTIYLGEQTDFLLFLKSFGASIIYYDPGIKLEFIEGKEKTKRRSQFRISFKNLNLLYYSWQEYRFKNVR